MSLSLLGWGLTAEGSEHRADSSDLGANGTALAAVVTTAKGAAV